MSPATSQETKAVQQFGCDDRYEVQQFLGQGSYGTVCSAVDTRSGEMVAIKKMTNVFSHVAETKRTLRELRLLRHFCHHENVLTIHNVLPPQESDQFNDIFIVTEMMDTDLDQVIRSPQQLSELHIQTFLYQILRGLQYVHNAHVIHRDLKPGNILVNQNCTVKICDFGLARLEPETGYGGFMTEYVVTRWYRAPEIMLSGQDYTQSIDVWSVGCILAEMLGRNPIFPGKNYVDQVRVIVELLGTPTEQGLMMIEDLEAREYVKSLPHKPKPDWASRYPNAGPDAADLLDKLLKFDPMERCSVEDALNHPYLAAIRAEDSDVFQPAAPFRFDFENMELSPTECKQLVVEEIEHYQRQDELLAMQEHMHGGDMGGWVGEGEPIPEWGRDSLQFEDDSFNEPQPPPEELKYNSMMVNMKRVMVGEVQETNWGTKMLTPVSEEREEELQRQQQEDDVLKAKERASERAASAQRVRQHAVAAASANLSQSAGPSSRATTDEADSRGVDASLPARRSRYTTDQPTRGRDLTGDLSSSDKPMAGTIRPNSGSRTRDPSPSGRGGRSLSAGAARTATAASTTTTATTTTKKKEGARDASPGMRRPRSATATQPKASEVKRANAENRVRSGSAGANRAKINRQGAPPPLPRKDPLPAAARQNNYSRTGRSGPSRGRASGRPNSAPNGKGRQGVASATTASSSAKRRQAANGEEDAGKAALHELLKTYKTKAEKELATGNMVRQPLRARYK